MMIRARTKPAKQWKSADCWTCTCRGKVSLSFSPNMAPPTSVRNISGNILDIHCLIKLIRLPNNNKQHRCLIRKHFHHFHRKQILNFNSSDPCRLHVIANFQVNEFCAAMIIIIWINVWPWDDMDAVVLSLDPHKRSVIWASDERRRPWSRPTLVEEPGGDVSLTVLQQNYVIRHFTNLLHTH